MFDEADRICVSVTFTWDLPEAERLARAWAPVAPVEIGGPATGMRGEEFTPGMYLRPGYTITSRGCPNRCWFCSVWKRDGDTRELPIHDGRDVLDDNLLACSRDHIEAVFAMLAKQSEPVKFTGGLEAARMEPWIAERIAALKPESAFFAYDTPDDLPPLRRAGQMLCDAGYSRDSHVKRCYVLCGFKGDSFEGAEARCREAWDAGFFPMAMLWRGKNGKQDPKWVSFQKQWARPMLVAVNLKEVKDLQGSSDGVQG